MKSVREKNFCVTSRICPHFHVNEEECGVVECDTGLIECVVESMCKGRKYEVCPLYIMSLFDGAEYSCVNTE